MTVGWILLFTQALSFNVGYEDRISNNQFDRRSGQPPKIYATRDECNQQLQNLVFKDSFPYRVSVLKGGGMFAQGFEKTGAITIHNEVICFEILDTPD